MAGQLEGLRVLELATGVAGPYAGRLLAMLGATVVKAEPPGGDPARGLRVDGDETAEPSAAFVHLNAGKRLVDRDALDVAAAVAWADVVLDGRVRAEVEPPLLDASLGHVLASVTAWGFEAAEAGEPGDELRVQAASGLMTATSTGRDGGEPLPFPGWQSQYVAGAYAAAAALAAAGEPGFRHVDVSWVGAILTGVEAGVARHLQRVSGPGGLGADDGQAGLQAGAFPSGVFACADGHVIPGTVRPVDWTLQCEVYGRPDLLEDDRFSWRNRWDNREALRAEIARWYEARSKREIFEMALGAGWAVGMVMTAADALDDPHLAERRFLSPVEGGPPGAVVAGRPWRARGVPEGEPVVLHEAGSSTAWFASAVRERAGPPAHALAMPRGLRVVELTWAWAGPFVGRFLSAWGADVVKVEAGRWPDGWRTRLRWREVDVPAPDGCEPDDVTWDAAALFNSLNRGKRSVSVDLTFPEGRELFVDLVRAADALVVNTSHSVLADRGVEEGVLAAVDDGLVVVQLPALGATGPYRAMPGYGMLIEGMGGFAARFGPATEGACATDTYYPDAVAGVHATVALLAAVAEARRSGTGVFVDLSQQEVMWLQLGEGIVLRSAEGRGPARLGSAGVPVDVVAGYDELHRDGTLAARGLVEEHDHPVTGRREYLGVPVRVDGAPVRTPRPAPEFAAHTDEVLGEWLGADPDRLAELRDALVIGTTPQQLRRLRRDAAAAGS